MCFWNIAGLINKCEETWEYIKHFDIIELTEIWIKMETWKSYKRKYAENIIDFAY